MSFLLSILKWQGRKTDDLLPLQFFRNHSFIRLVCLIQGEKTAKLGDWKNTFSILEINVVILEGGLCQCA
jgi:hypothetical protein